MKIQSVSILGSTGSIGTQALDVAEKLGLRVTALSAGRNIDLLERQIRKFRPAAAAVADEQAARELKARMGDMAVRILGGSESAAELAAMGQPDMVLNAILGMAGLAPTLEALRARKPLALANKESLVAGGSLVMKTARENGGEIIPVDSEHSAIFQCLQGCADRKRELKKIILTASGGPFFGYTRAQLTSVTPAQALHHPTWSMGAHITIDSATLMNKGRELIEAVWLFGVKPEQVEIVVHRESVIHSAVEFADNAIIAQMGVPDMRIPIQYAFTCPERVESPAAELDLFALGRLTFARPDPEVFPCLAVCREAIRRGGLVPAAANGADEQAVQLFLEGRIGFTDIGDLVKAAARRQQPGEAAGWRDISDADAAARRFVLEAVGRRPIDSGE